MSATEPFFEAKILLKHPTRISAFLSLNSKGNIIKNRCQYLPTLLINGIILQMATGIGLRNISKARLKSADTLIADQDWDGAAAMLGLSLECALKAVICKTLHLATYPENTRSARIDNFFMSHDFDALLKASGMEHLFSLTGTPEAFKNWSEFTKELPGDWINLRYILGYCNETKVRAMYNNLIDPNGGIITIIKHKHLW